MPSQSNFNMQTHENPYYNFNKQTKESKYGSTSMDLMVCTVYALAPTFILWYGKSKWQAKVTFGVQRFWWD